MAETYRGADFDDRAYAMLVDCGLLRTWLIASRMGVTAAYARRRLIAMASAGRIQKSERYSAINDLAWTVPLFPAKSKA